MNYDTLRPPGGADPPAPRGVSAKGGPPGPRRSALIDVPPPSGQDGAADGQRRVLDETRDGPGGAARAQSFIQVSLTAREEAKLQAWARKLSLARGLPITPAHLARLLLLLTLAAEEGVGDA